MRALTILLLAVALAGCGGSETASPPATTEAVAGTGTTSSSRVSGTTLDGSSISLDDYRGKPVLVNVWSSW
jgi:cytochrome oxidase Cu insertion factor (SCO1/SenC/PrrC family)